MTGCADEPLFSVVVCTYNPRQTYLSECLARIGDQLGPARAELIVIDNNSDPALRADELEAVAKAPVWLAREPRQGLTWARCAGLAAARAPLICFVDDDNFLAGDYLAAASAAALSHPEVGVFGGRALSRLEVEPDRLVRHYLPFLGVRDLGDDNLIGSGAAWGPHEPIGAGLVMRREVGSAFKRFVEATDGAFGLGRSGDALLSGEDSLISRIADRLGYSVGYFPDLSLEHSMPAARLTRRYVFRLLEAQGRTHVILEAIAGLPPQRAGTLRSRLTRAERFLHRLKVPGWPEALGHWHWDRGYFAEAASGRATLAFERGPEALRAAAEP